MSVQNTPVREFDTFRPMSGKQASHVQCPAVLLSLPPPQPHTSEEEIEQTYESVSQATSFYKPKSFEERVKKRYGKHSVEVGSSALGPCYQTPRGEPLGDPSLIPNVNLSRCTSRMAGPEQMAHATQRDETNDETIVPPQNLSTFSVYSNTIIRVLDEQTEASLNQERGKNGHSSGDNHLSNPTNSHWGT